MTVHRINESAAIGVKAIINGKQVGNVWPVDASLRPEIRERRLDLMEQELRNEILFPLPQNH